MSTQTHWGKVVELHKQKVTEGRPGALIPTRYQLGLPHTWAANNFVSYWTQSVALRLTYHVAATAWMSILSINNNPPKGPKKRRPNPSKQKPKSKPGVKPKPKPGPKPTSSQPGPSGGVTPPPRTRTTSATRVVTLAKPAPATKRKKAVPIPSSSSSDSSSSSTSSKPSKSKSKVAARNPTPSPPDDRPFTLVSRKQSRKGTSRTTSAASSGSEKPSTEAYPTTMALDQPFDLSTPKRRSRFTNGSPSGQVSIRVPKPVYSLDDLLVEEEAQGRVRHSPGGSAHTSSRIPSKTAAASKADHLAAGRVKVTKGLAGTTSTYLNLADRRVTTMSSN